MERLLVELRPFDAELRQQLTDATAYANCSCGCPSVYVVVGPHAQPSTLTNADLMAHHPSGGLVAALSIRDGIVRELDCWTQFEEPPFFPPKLDTLDAWDFSQVDVPAR